MKELCKFAYYLNENVRKNHDIFRYVTLINYVKKSHLKCKENKSISKKFIIKLINLIIIFLNCNMYSESDQIY